MLGMTENLNFQSLAFDFKSLDIFQAVYATLSMTLAGHHLEMTQSAISQSIAQLEERLAVPLFKRQRPLVPTPAADKLNELAVELLLSAEHLQSSVCTSTARPLARVGMVDSFAATVGPKLVPRLRGRSEHLTVWAGISRNLEAELISGKLDILIGSQPLKHVKEIAAYPLLCEPYFIVLPDRMAKSMAGSNDKTWLRNLVHNHTFVRYSQRSKIGVDIEQYLRQVSLVPPQSFEFDGTEAAFAMVNGGLGWMISTPLCLIHGSGVESGLTAMPLPESCPSRTLYLLVRKDLAKDVVKETLREAKEITSTLIENRLGELARWALEMVKVG
jgi:DNA-binding transcriptional LysR family regulator